MPSQKQQQSPNSGWLNEMEKSIRDMQRIVNELEVAIKSKSTTPRNIGKRGRSEET